MRSRLTRADVALLARALRLSRATLYRHAAAGMPADPHAARAWLVARRHRSPGAGVPHRRRATATMAEIVAAIKGSTN